MANRGKWIQYSIDLAQSIENFSGTMFFVFLKREDIK